MIAIRIEPMTRTRVADMSEPTLSKTLEGQVAVVTGASSGIGAAIARRLAAEGARIVLGYNSGADRAEEVRRDLAGDGHFAMHVSLADQWAHEPIRDMLLDEVRRVDILVNSAGFTQRIPHQDVEALTPALFNEMLTTNTGGTYSFIRALMPLLKASAGATVINISSVSAFTGSGSNVAYCAAKAALDTMTISLARAFGPGIRFVCVSPAAVDTEFVVGRDRNELLRKASATPLGRVVSADDVALAALACVTHLKTATGTRIVIDGGHSL